MILTSTAFTSHAAHTQVHQAPRTCTHLPVDSQRQGASSRLLHSKQACPLPPQQTCMHTRGAAACRRALWARRDQERSQNGHVRAAAAAVRRCWVTPRGMCSWCRSAADGKGHEVSYEVNGPCRPGMCAMASSRAAQTRVRDLPQRQAGKRRRETSKSAWLFSSLLSRHERSLPNKSARTFDVVPLPRIAPAMHPRGESGGCMSHAD